MTPRGLRIPTARAGPADGGVAGHPDGLYHLTAEEEPEQLDYPGQKNPEAGSSSGEEQVLARYLRAR